MYIELYNQEGDILLLDIVCYSYTEHIKTNKKQVTVESYSERSFPNIDFNEYNKIRIHFKDNTEEYNIINSSSHIWNEYSLEMKSYVLSITVEG